MQTEIQIVMRRRHLFTISGKWELSLLVIIVAVVPSYGT